VRTLRFKVAQTTKNFQIFFVIYQNLFLEKIMVVV